MDYELSQLQDFDLFFYYGEQGSDLKMEIESDLLMGMVQKKRSLFYDRRDSVGVSEKENYPNSFVLAFMARYDIVNWTAWKNTQISDGSSTYPDRRIAVSQNSIEISQRGQEMDLKVNYIPFFDIKKSGNVQTLIGA